MKKYYIWLLKVFGYCSPELGELLERFETAEGIYNAFQNNIAAAGAEYARKASEVTIEDAESLLTALEKKSISVITYEDELYPEALRNIQSPPCLLFARGNVELLRNKLVTIGGSRKITDYTIAAETAVCEQLCRKYTLVGSLVAGCEQLACLTAVKCGKGCIAVLPCGFDQDYPMGSNVIREQILMSGGCIITEFLPDVKSSNANFLRRARIYGSISKAMIIFQARIGSGSLNAAKYSPALFFLPPHDVFSREYAGAVQGVRGGASLYLSEEDIERAFQDSFTPQTLDITAMKQSASKEAKQTVADKKENKKTPAESSEPSEEQFETCVHYSVYKRISASASPVIFDELYRSEEVELADLSEILLDLEIEGLIKALPGSRYTLC